MQSLLLLIKHYHINQKMLFTATSGKHTVNCRLTAEKRKGEERESSAEDTKVGRLELLRTVFFEGIVSVFICTIEYASIIEKPVC